MNNYNPTEMLAEEMMARMSAANREIEQLRAALAAANARAEAAKARADAMRADIDILCGLLDGVLDGMTVQELAALGDALDAVRERWGLGEVQG